MSKLSTYYGHSDYENRRAHVYALAHDNYAAQAWDGSTSFRLGEFPTEEQAEMACEDYVLGFDIRTSEIENAAICRTMSKQE